MNDVPTPGWHIALRYKISAFTPQLAKGLSQDRATQARCKDLVGLDFDPFLNTQDPAERYEIDGSRPGGRGYLVDIYSVRDGQRGEKADVRAEVVQSSGKWLFANLYYSDGTDLLSILTSPRPPCTAPKGASTKEPAER